MKSVINFTILCALLVGCNINSANDLLVKEAKKGKETWVSQGYTSYEYRYQTPCFCAFTAPVIVVVENNTVQQVLDLETREPFTIPYGGEERPVFDVYPELFNTITGFYDQWIEQIPKVYKAEIEWDKKSGMPESVYFDHIKDAIDDEISYLFSDLKIN